MEPVTDDAGQRTEERSEGRSSATRSRIIEAALQTVREEGFAETTARAIARHGGFNQALIFYHFGSVDALLVAVARSESEIGRAHV